MLREGAMREGGSVGGRGGVMREGGSVEGRGQC